MEDLSLHILDIVENSITAKASKVRIELVDDETSDTFTLTISDNGVGMDEDTLKRALDPFFTTKTVRNFGMGIPLLAQSAEECGGRLTIESVPSKGTTLRATFQRGHLDMKPIGDIGATMITLIAGHPEVDYELVYNRQGYCYEINTAELRAELKEEGLRDPVVLDYIKRHVNEGIKGA
jgi:anti-sigma regulatory factor (Ser/Thr protein kinase)